MTERPERCSVCGAQRVREGPGLWGACSLVPGRDGKGGCPDPLFDVRRERHEESPPPASPPPAAPATPEDAAMAMGQALDDAETENRALRAEVARLTAERDEALDALADQTVNHAASEHNRAAAEATLAALRAEMDEAIDLLRECAPLTEHNSDAPPPHRLCMRCGVDAALASVERGAKP